MLCGIPMYPSIMHLDPLFRCRRPQDHLQAWWADAVAGPDDCNYQLQLHPCSSSCCLDAPDSFWTLHCDAAVRFLAVDVRDQVTPWLQSSCKQDLWNEEGCPFCRRLAVFVHTGFGATASSSAETHSLSVQRNRASEHYFHGVAMFTVSCCLCLKVFLTKIRVEHNSIWARGWKELWLCFLSRLTWAPLI